MSVGRQKIIDLVAREQRQEREALPTGRVPALQQTTLRLHEGLGKYLKYVRSPKPMFSPH